MGLNRFTGTPWHVERYTREEGDERRHRSRCVYFRKQGTYCCKISDRCFGSAHCQNYKEASNEEITSAPTTTGTKKHKTSSAPLDGTILFRVGDRVEHTRFGVGLVVNVTPHTLTIEFADGDRKDLIIDVLKSSTTLRILS